LKITRTARACLPAAALLFAPPAFAEGEPTKDVAPASPVATEAPKEPAKEAPKDGANDAVPKDLPRLVLDTGRTEVKPPDDELVRFQIHGEYQMRYQVQRSFPMDATTTTVNRVPGALEDSLGQNHFLSHWLRLSPRLQFKKSIEVISQFDLVTGMVAGEKTHDVRADLTPRDEYNGFSNVQLRQLYAQITTGIGVVRVGHQPSHWGMGIIANDGDHPTLFGDYRYGAIAERILFATKPGGKDSDVVVALAGDLVFRDSTARLTRGDHAFQGVLAAYYEKGPNQLGVYAVYRNQTNDKQSMQSFFPYTEGIEAGVVDASGRFAAPIPGNDAFLFGAAEVATVFGSTNMLRTQAQALDGSKTTIRSYGGALQLGVVHKSACDCSARGSNGSRPKAPIEFGDLVAQIELGYASGDADPYDGTSRRFTIDGNHRIGLVLFDEVMRWQTARAATAAQDPLLTNAERPTPGIDLLPSNGGISGAQYVNPTFVYRPVPRLDLKGGMVIAQATADVVDPYRLATQGAYVNYRGGDAKRHDLGVELDAGFEYRLPLNESMTLQLGAQGGVLFPGGALANIAGERMKNPWLTVFRLGVQF
jgi:hypothetical protein